MADETLSTDISGANGLPAAVQADLDLDNTFAAFDDSNGNTVYVSMRQILTAFGNLIFTGDATGTGLHGSIALTIANAAVTLAKQAALPAHTAIGNPTGISATPQAFTFDPASFVFVGSQLQATAAAAASDASSMYDYERFGSGAL